MPTIDWTEDEAEEVRQILLDEIHWMSAESDPGLSVYLDIFRTVLRKLEAAYAND